MTIQGIHHVQITIPDDAESEEKARHFYCGVLGLQEIAKPDSVRNFGGFWVTMGGQDLHIGVENGFDRLLTQGHIAYRVDDLAGWRQRIVACGLEIETDTPLLPGFDRFQFRDPFGNRVEFIEVQ